SMPGRMTRRPYRQPVRCSSCSKSPVAVRSNSESKLVTRSPIPGSKPRNNHAVDHRPKVKAGAGDHEDMPQGILEFEFFPYVENDPGRICDAARQQQPER